jgi:hypothetical protein
MRISSLSELGFSLLALFCYFSDPDVLMGSLENGLQYACFVAAYCNTHAVGDEVGPGAD